MGQHRALGQARGAAGILQHGDIVQADSHRFQRVPTALLQGGLERYRLRQVVGRDHLLDLIHHRVDQPALGRRHQVAHLRFDQELDARVRQHLLDQLAEQVQVHQGASTGILELMAHFPSGVQGVGVDHDQPGAQGSEHGNGVMQYVGHLHGNTVAGHKVGMLLQVGGKGCGVTLDLRIAEGDAHIAECRPIGELLARAFKHLDYRFIGTQVQL
ncbi:hypothetical protein D3C85_1251170 [compost metagenome]